MRLRSYESHSYYRLSASTDNRHYRKRDTTMTISVTRRQVATIAALAAVALVALVAVVLLTRGCHWLIIEIFGTAYERRANGAGGICPSHLVKRPGYEVWDLYYTCRNEQERQEAANVVDGVDQVRSLAFSLFVVVLFAWFAGRRLMTWLNPAVNSDNSVDTK